MFCYRNMIFWNVYLNMNKIIMALISIVWHKYKKNSWVNWVICHKNFPSCNVYLDLKIIMMLILITLIPIFYLFDSRIQKLSAQYGFQILKISFSAETDKTSKNQKVVFYTILRLFISYSNFGKNVSFKVSKLYQLRPITPIGVSP